MNEPDPDTLPEDWAEGLTWEQIRDTLDQLQQEADYERYMYEQQEMEYHRWLQEQQYWDSYEWNRDWF